MKSARHLGVAAAAVAGLATALPSPAQMQPRTVPGAPAWYFGGGAGVSWPQFTGSDWNNVANGLNGAGFGPGLSQSTTNDSTAVAWKVFGGYRVMPYLGFEVGYTNFGRFDYNYSFSQAGVQTGTANMSWKGYSINAVAVPRLPINQGLFVQGKIGAAFTSVDNNISVNLPTLTQQTSQGKSKTNLLAGAGIGYDFPNGLGLLLEYEWYGKVGDQFTYSSTDGVQGTGQAQMQVITVNGLIRF